MEAQHPSHSALLTLNAFVASFCTHRQFLAAFGPPSIQYIAAIGRSHSLAKAMLITALAYRGLKCPFHDASVFRWIAPPKFGTAKIVTDDVLPNWMTQRLQSKPRIGRNFGPWRKADGKTPLKRVRKKKMRR